VKRYKMEMCVPLVAILAIAGLVCAGCSTARGNMALGRTAVVVALRVQAVNEVELALARPYLVYLERILRAEPAKAPVLLAEMVEEEIGNWGGSLTNEERSLVCDVVYCLLIGVEARARTPEEARAAAQAADIVAGILAAIDAIVPQVEGPG